MHTSKKRSRPKQTKTTKNVYIRKLNKQKWQRKPPNEQKIAVFGATRKSPKIKNTSYLNVFRPIYKLPER